MINLKENVTLHNHYDIQVVDSITGEVKQTVSVDNMVLNAVWKMFMFIRTDNGNVPTTYPFYKLYLGKGTVPPLPTDTALGNVSHNLSLNSNNTVLLSKEETFPTSTYTYQFTVPATTAYVGDFTEIGIEGRSYNTDFLWTHAFFEDSEGNPITVSKTDLDILIITYTVYVTLNSVDKNFTWVHPYYNKINTIFRNNGGNVPFSLTKNNSSSSLIICNDLPVDDTNAIRRHLGVSLGGISVVDEETRVAGITTKRLTAENGNGSYYHGFVFDGIGGVVLPNFDVFPAQTISGITIGAGDGSTTEFNTPLRYFIKDSDVIYVNGVAKERGVDYTIKNACNHTNQPDLCPASFLYVLEEHFENATYIYTSRPLVLALSDKAIVKEFNKIRLGIFYSWGNLSGASYGAYWKRASDGAWFEEDTARFGSVHVDISQDNEVWERIHTFDLSQNRGGGSSVGAHVWEHLFDSMREAKYLRYSLDTTNATDERIRDSLDARLQLVGLGTNSGIICNDTGPQLVFTEAPPQDAIITMDAAIDRPYKTDQFVIDAGMTLHFGDV